MKKLILFICLLLWAEHAYAQSCNIGDCGKASITATNGISLANKSAGKISLVQNIDGTAKGWEIAATSGDLTPVGGAGFAGTVPITGAISTTTTVTAGTGITSTTGDIVATAGAVNAGTTMTAGTGITATTGNITSTAGDHISPAAAKGFVAGEASRAANVTTATTLAVPLYLAAAASGTHLGAIVGFGASASGAILSFFKTRAVTGAATTIVQSGDVLGAFNFYGANGTTYDPAARIVVTSSTTPGATTDMPGKIDFLTTPDGSVTPASALSLDHNKLATFGGAISGATTITAGTGITATTGNITASTGNILASAGSITAGTTINATSDFTTNGNLVLQVSGGTISLQEATAGSKCMGTATANGTTAVTVSTTCATTDSRIFISRTSVVAAGVTEPGCWATNIVNATSFDLDCNDAAEDSTFNWIIFHESP